MTGADFTGVDIDLLADYVGGALAGTPDAARVATLIADDPAWRDAHALISDGMAEVGDTLNAWGAVPEPMPMDVAARLDAVFAETGGAAAASGRHLAAVRETGVARESMPRPPARRRALRWGAPIAAAAAVVAFAGVGLAYLNTGTSASDSASDSPGSGQAAQAAPEVAGGLATFEITSTGIDYGPDSLAAGPSLPFSAPNASTAAPRSSPQELPSGTDKDLAEPLARLQPQDALQACLDAIAGQNAAGPITVQTVDYARFSGAPALVVHFTAGNGVWAWASGPGCGLPGVGANTRFSVKVG